MPNRTSVLDEYTETNGLYGLTTSTINLSSPGQIYLSYFMYCSLVTKVFLQLADDKLFIEDDSGRIALSGAIMAHLQTLVTGVVIAIRGHQSELGIFNVCHLLQN